MATETLQPDGSVFQLTNLSGAATDVDEGVDSPDGVWLTLGDDGLDSIVRASFPTPTGDPATGAGLQKFRLYVRVGTAAGGNDPTLDLAVRETGGGSDLAVLIGQSVTSHSGEIIEFAWDASVLGTADGSAVEIYVIGQRSGGSPTVRRCVEFDAIEWVVDYSAGSPGTVTPGVVAATTAAPTPSIAAAAKVTPNVVAVSFAVPVPVAAAAPVVIPSTIAIVAAAPGATITIAPTVQPNVVGATTTIPPPSVTAAAVVIPAVIVVAVTLPTPIGHNSPVQVDTSPQFSATFRFSGRKILRTSNGTLWVVVPQAVDSIPRLRYSTDDGANWSTSSTAFPETIDGTDAAWVFCSDGAIYMLYQVADSTSIRVRQGTLNGGHTDITSWSAATTVNAARSDNFDLAVHEEGGDTIVHVVYGDFSTLCEYRRAVWGSAFGSATTLTSWSGATSPRIDFNHTQADVTAILDSAPHAYVAWHENGNIMFRKAVYSSGPTWTWNDARTITTDATLGQSFAMSFDGTSCVMTVESTATADALLVLERDAADTTTTALANTPTRDGTVTAATDITYNPDRDIEVFHSDSTAKVLQRVIYDRSGSVWGSWVTIDADADDQFPNVKIGYWSGSKDDAVELVWTDQTGTPYPLMHERFTFAAAPTTVTPGVITTTSALPAPTVAIPATVTPTVATVLSALPAPTITVAPTVTPSVIATVSVLPAPDIAAAATIVPAVILTTSTLPTPSITAAATLTPGVIATTSTLPTPTIAVPVTVAPSAIAAVLTLPAPTLSIAATTTPSVIAAILALPTPSITAAAKVTPSVIATPVTLPTPVTIGDLVVATPAVIATVSTLPAPTIQVFATVSPGVILTTVTIAGITLANWHYTLKEGFDTARFFRLGATQLILVRGLSRSATTGFSAKESWATASGAFAVPNTREAQVVIAVQGVWAANKGATDAALTLLVNDALNDAGYRKPNGAIIS